MSLRELIESDLAETLESTADFGLPVILVDPEGVSYGPYNGQVLYDTKATNDFGEEIVQHKPVVTLRRSSLARVPLASEKDQWLVRIPTIPSLTAAKETFVLGHPGETGGSIGFIRLYLTKSVQS